MEEEHWGSIRFQPSNLPPCFRHPTISKQKVTGHTGVTIFFRSITKACHVDGVACLGCKCIKFLQPEFIFRTNEYPSQLHTYLAVFLGSYWRIKVSSCTVCNGCVHQFRCKS